MTGEIAALDRALASAGGTVTLRRFTPASTPVDINVAARWRFFEAEEITGGVAAGDLRVILSPTGLDNAAWLAAAGPAGIAPFDEDRRPPRIGDRVIVAGRLRRIENVNPIVVGGQLVRIELQCR